MGTRCLYHVIVMCPGLQVKRDTQQLREFEEGLVSQYKFYLENLEQTIKGVYLVDFILPSVSYLQTTQTGTQIENYIAISEARLCSDCTPSHSVSVSLAPLSQTLFTMSLFLSSSLPLSVFSLLLSSHL